MRLRVVGSLLVVVSVIAVAACGSETSGGSAASLADRGAATVTLDVYSGLPNPTWGLDADQSAEFLAQWDVLAIATPTDYPAILGYRGMLVDFADGTRIWVNHGFAVADGVDGALARADTGRALESWLLETGASIVDPALLELVRLDISG